MLNCIQSLILSDEKEEEEEYKKKQPIKLKKQWKEKLLIVHTRGETGKFYRLVNERRR